MAKKKETPPPEGALQVCDGCFNAYRATEPACPKCGKANRAEGGRGFLDDADADPVLKQVASEGDRIQALRREKLTGSAAMRELKRLATQLLEHPRKERLMLLRQACAALDLRLRDPELSRMLAEAWLESRGRSGPLRTGDRLNLAEQQWILPGVLLAGGSHLVIALPKVGKSALLLGLIAAWSRGQTFLGRTFTAPCPEVLLAWPDQGEGDVARMLAAAGLLEPNGDLRPPIAALWHAGRPLPLDDEGIATLAEEAARRPGCLVVVDSYAAATRPLALEEADAAFAGPLQALIEELDPTGATLLVVHHAGKGRQGDGPASLSRGSTALPAVPSMLLALAKANPGDREDRRLLLHVEGRGGPPETLAIQRDDDRWICCGTGEELLSEQRREAAREKLTPRQEAALEVVERRWGAGQGESTVADLVADPDCELEGKHAGRLGRKVLQALGRLRLVQLRKVGTGISARPWSDEGPGGPPCPPGPIGPGGPQIGQGDGSADQRDQKDQPDGGDQGDLFDRLQQEADQLLLGGMD